MIAPGISSVCWDADLHFSDLNKTGEVFWGVRKEQVCGAPFSAVAGKDLSRRLSQALRQEETQFREVLKNRAGPKI